MVYYENRYTNRIFDDNALKFAKEVYGDQVDQDIDCGYLRKLDEEPDCVTLIRRASFSTAVRRYMELNNVGYKEAQAGVRKIVDTMSGTKKKHKHAKKNKEEKKNV